ncbi:hypothetical protein D3C72_2310010 [compost metagenome]
MIPCLAGKGTFHHLAACHDVQIAVVENPRDRQWRKAGIGTGANFVENPLFGRHAFERAAQHFTGLADHAQVGRNQWQIRSLDLADVERQQFFSDRHDFFRAV